MLGRHPPEHDRALARAAATERHALSGILAFAGLFVGMIVGAALNRYLYPFTFQPVLLLCVPGCAVLGALAGQTPYAVRWALRRGRVR